LGLDGQSKSQDGHESQGFEPERHLIELRQG